jgi:hypothetical protein
VLPERSSWFSDILGAEVDDAQDGPWRRCFMTSVLLGCQAFPRGDRCGRVSLPPTPPYVMWPSDEGLGLPVRRGLVSLCRSGRWRLSGGCEAPELDI